MYPDAGPASRRVSTTDSVYRAWPGHLKKCPFTRQRRFGWPDGQATRMGCYTYNALNRMTYRRGSGFQEDQYYGYDWLGDIA